MMAAVVNRDLTATLVKKPQKPWENCQVHNLKVVGSNPTPATKITNKSVIKKDAILRDCVFFCSWLGVFSDFTLTGR